MVACAYSLPGGQWDSRGTGNMEPLAALDCLLLQLGLRHFLVKVEAAGAGALTSRGRVDPYLPPPAGFPLRAKLYLPYRRNSPSPGLPLNSNVAVLISQS